VRADIVPGAEFPDYELPDHTGTLRRLSELQDEDPMIVVIAREAYSAKDQIQHEGLVHFWREMKPGVGYCRMVTITTTNPQETLNYRSGVGAEWPFLADPGRIVQRDLDIAEYTDPDHNQMVPHTIVLEPGLVVYKVYNGYWFFGRPTVEELRHDLRAILMKVHWDWDLSDPEVRAAWKRGETDRFYPPELGWPESAGEAVGSANGWPSDPGGVARPSLAAPAAWGIR
jgi:peroxiredoxin